jgi:hypothetical protein
VALNRLNMKLPTLVFHVSMKKLRRARAMAPAGELEGGARRRAGSRSARNCTMMPDSMRVCSLGPRIGEEMRMAGTSPR